jgi:hypothetical protein
MDIIENEKQKNKLKNFINNLLQEIDDTKHYEDEGQLIVSPDYDGRVLIISISSSSTNIWPQLWNVEIEVFEGINVSYDIEVETYLGRIIELFEKEQQMDVIGYILHSTNFIHLFVASFIPNNFEIDNQAKITDWRTYLPEPYPGIKIFQPNN